MVFLTKQPAYFPQNFQARKLLLRLTRILCRRKPATDLRVPLDILSLKSFSTLLLTV